MSLKESLQKKLETQTEYWSKQIDSLRAEADEKMAKAKDDQAEAEIQREFSERIQAVEDHIETARSKLGELKDSGEDQLEAGDANLVGCGAARTGDAYPSDLGGGLRIACHLERYPFTSHSSPVPAAGLIL